ncbi:hypothetical protein LTS16_020882 [Friedmanniomyces endolithicus]|nr:hypothetical protein LTS16_020882 [Friedmanniomyces endolithicus]
MAEETPEIARGERGERRGSLGRMLETLKGAVSRREGSSSKGSIPVSTMATADVLAQEIPPETQTDSPLHANAAPTAEVSGPQIPPTRSMVALEDGAIAADEEAVDDLDESLLPMLYSRVGVDHDRTKAMFTRHGFAYEPRRRSSEEPAPKFRRVERRIRVRLHTAAISAKDSLHQTSHARSAATVVVATAVDNLASA